MRQQGQLVAVADANPVAANAAGASFETPVFYSIHQLLASVRVDVLAVCTPNGLHAQHTQAALAAGCHVLCEKPMAITVPDALAMAKAATKVGKQLFVVKQNRFNPPVQAVKQLLDEGRLGKVLSVQVNGFWNRGADYYAHSWKGTLALDGGTLYTQFSHFIDLLVWFFGPLYPTAAVLANRAHVGIIEFEDCGVVMGTLANGAPLSLHYTVNAYRQNMEGSITIFGEKGTVKIGGQYLNELDYQQLEGEGMQNLRTGNPANHYGTYMGSMSNHPQVYANMLAVLQGRGSMINSVADAIETVRFIDAVYALGR
jgi:UDP-N-acetyl-2-amino-2-deoxyglucuronate dehydrogenase